MAKPPSLYIFNVGRIADRVVVPKEGFLQTIGELVERHGFMFILDEVITAFRQAMGGA